MKPLYDAKITFNDEMMMPARALGSIATMSDGKVTPVGASWLIYAVNEDTGQKIYLGQIHDRAEYEETMAALREGFANRSLHNLRPKVAKEIADTWKLALPEPEPAPESEA